jgi:putative transposase
MRTLVVHSDIVSKIIKHALLYKLWTHVVFATKNRSLLITPTVEQKLYPYLHDLLTELGCVVSIINRVSDHVHLLFLMTEVLKNVKGNSSHWINQNEICHSTFSWQTGYAAFSVSDEAIEKVYRYTAHQKQHHEHVTFMTEYKEMIDCIG